MAVTDFPVWHWQKFWSNYPFFVAEYAARWDEAVRTGARIFFADETHFRAEAELQGQWVLKGEPAW